MREKKSRAVQSDRTSLGRQTAVKFARTVERLPISQGRQIPEIIDMTKDIQVFGVSYVRPLGAKFRSSKGFVAAIEEMLLLYEGVVQNSQSYPSRTSNP